MNKFSNQDIDIRKYLQFLDDEGWSELIDERWKNEVKKLLVSQFPEMTKEEWNEIARVVFW
ncbi:MAG: hypothetical protein PUC18_06470 [Prevotellaceae bacterium]|nr:hypothetical protein [Prevotellaceae bacterium]